MLIGLLVVTAIAGILAAMLFPLSALRLIRTRARSGRQRTKEKRA